MRLTPMTRARLFAVALPLIFGLTLAVRPAAAQKALPVGTGNTFKDTSMIKPPAGAKVAIYEFEDLECPACAAAHPTVLAAEEHYKIPLVRKDFPLQMHIWSTDAAIWARFMQDKISPKIADEYRTAVFAAQQSIASKDDMLTFTRRFFQSHGGQMPFVVDPTGQFRKEVYEDRTLGEKMGLTQTPTIFVCSEHAWIQVTKPEVLYQAIEQMESQVASAPALKKTAAR